MLRLPRRCIRQLALASSQILRAGLALLSCSPLVLTGCEESDKRRAAAPLPNLDLGDFCIVEQLAFNSCKEGTCGVVTAERPEVCRDGSCRRGSTDQPRCTKPCSDDSECVGGDKELVCGIAADGARKCVPACPSDGFPCVDGVSTECSHADETHCNLCGCADGLRCEPGVGCLPKSDVDEHCRYDEDCRTKNCSLFASVCRVPVGQACTTSNCDYCLGAGSTSYCSRECDAHFDCNGGVCAQTAASSLVSYCMPPCDSFSDTKCSGRCELTTAPRSTSDDARRFACVRGGMSAKRPVGGACRNDTQCTLGRCDSVPLCTSENCFGAGFCSTGCATDASCGAYNRCVQVPCSSSSAKNCGAMCMRSCEQGCRGFGTCAEYDRVQGGSAEVCDPRRADGSACALDVACRSGVCANKRCADASGVENGEACDQTSDCASGTCVNGKCRGTAILGDECSTSSDCAVGGCSDGVCS